MFCSLPVTFVCSSALNHMYIRGWRQQLPAMNPHCWCRESFPSSPPPKSTPASPQKWIKERKKERFKPNHTADCLAQGAVGRAEESSEPWPFYRMERDFWLSWCLQASLLGSFWAHTTPMQYSLSVWSTGKDCPRRTQKRVGREVASKGAGKGRGVEKIQEIFPPHWITGVKAHAE